MKAITDISYIKKTITCDILSKINAMLDCHRNADANTKLVNIINILLDYSKQYHA